MQYNRKSVTVVTQPAELPVTVGEMKAILKIDGASEDATLLLYIKAATDAVEKYLGASIVTRTLKLTTDGLNKNGDEALARMGDGVFDLPKSYFYNGAGSLDLPYGPVQSITSFVSYNDANIAATYPASQYFTDTAGDRLVLNDGQVWPTDLRDHACIEITYVAGYGAAANVPPAIAQAIREQVKAMYECAGVCDMCGGARALLDGYKRYDMLGFV